MKFSINDLKEKVKDLKGKINKDTILPWVEAHKKQIAIGGIAVCLAIVLMVVFVGNGKKQAAVGKTGDTAESIAIEDQAVEDPNDLKQDAYPEINALMETYYTCMAAGDVEGVKAVVDVLSAEEQEYIEALKTLIEGYQNLRCYTKRGIEENSYLVFVRYDLKFTAAETTAPGVEGYYVKMADNGQYYIMLDELDDATSEYITQLVEDEDVQMMYQEVWIEFEAAKAADEKLAEYGVKLEQLKASEEGWETSAEGETSEETGEPAEETEEPVEEPEVEGPEVEGPETEQPSEEGTAVNKETRFTESTNVRAQRTADSERLALGYQGESVTRVEDYDDGWSKIIFKGKEGYCRTSCLED